MKASTIANALAVLRAVEALPTLDMSDPTYRAFVAVRSDVTRARYQIEDALREVEVQVEREAA